MILPPSTLGPDSVDCVRNLTPTIVRRSIEFPRGTAWSRRLTHPFTAGELITLQSRNALWSFSALLLLIEFSYRESRAAGGGVVAGVWGNDRSAGYDRRSSQCCEISGHSDRAGRTNRHPGIVDSHAHMLFGALALHGLNLSLPDGSITVDKPEILVTRLRSYADTSIHTASQASSMRQEISAKSAFTGCFGTARDSLCGPRLPLAPLPILIV